MFESIKTFIRRALEPKGVVPPGEPPGPSADAVAAVRRIADRNRENTADFEYLNHLCSAASSAELKSSDRAVEIAARDNDWQAVTAISEYRRQCGIRSPLLYSHYFDALINFGNLGGAEELLKEGRALFSDSDHLEIKWARLASIQGDYNVAAERWLAAQRRLPEVVECYDMACFCLEMLGDFPAAENILYTAMQFCPEQIEFWLRFVRAALRVNNLAEARLRFVEREAQFGDDVRTVILAAELEFAEGNIQRSRELLECSFARSDGLPNQAQTDLQIKLEQAAQRDMMMCFESLGGVLEGCEFGLVQRAYGAEPLGLLRWSSITPDGLIDALENDFSGIGEPDSMNLHPPAKDGDDWLVEHPRYSIHMHTFLRDLPSEEAFNRIFSLMSQRSSFLKRKLLEDLAAGEKIFVFKVTYEVLSAERLDRLANAIARYGQSTLLYVRQPDDEHPPGTVERVRTGLFIGYIERFSFGFGHGAPYLGPATREWETLVRRCYDLWLNFRAEATVGRNGVAFSSHETQAEKPPTAIGRS